MRHSPRSRMHDGDMRIQSEEITQRQRQRDKCGFERKEREREQDHKAVFPKGVREIFPPSKFAHLSSSLLFGPVIAGRRRKKCIYSVICPTCSHASLLCFLISYVHMNTPKSSPELIKFICKLSWEMTCKTQWGHIEQFLSFVSKSSLFFRNPFFPVEI